MKNPHIEQKPKTAFTIIELVIAITIIAVLSTMGTMVYTSSLQSSRDARRKSDLEQIRSALELYRSNSGTSLYPTSMLTITDYIRIPKEMKNNQNYGYLYQNNGNDYMLGAVLEKNTGPTCPPLPSVCYTLSSTNPLPTPCNYCIGPYGTK